MKTLTIPFLGLTMLLLCSFSDNPNSNSQSYANTPIDCYEYSINMYNMSLAAGNTEEEAKIDGYNALEGCLEIKEVF